MRKAPPIIIHHQGDWPSAKLAARISAFHSGCIERRLESTDLTVEQKIKAIDGIIKILKTEEA